MHVIIYTNRYIQIKYSLYDKKEKKKDLYEDWIILN